MFEVFNETPEHGRPLASTSADWAPVTVAEQGPRPTRLRTYARISIYVPLLVSLLVIALGLPYVLFQSGTSERLAKQGEVIQAEIVDKQESDSRRAGTYYALTYRYEYKGVEVTGVQSVDRETFLQKDVTGTVSVTVLPSDPRVHQFGRVSPQEAGNDQLKGSIVVMVVALGFGLYGQFYRKRARAQGKILQNWIARPAKVTEVRTQSLSRRTTESSIFFRTLLPDGRVDEYQYVMTNRYGAPVRVGDAFTAMVPPNAEGGVTPLFALEMVELTPSVRS